MHCRSFFLPRGPGPCRATGFEDQEIRRRLKVHLPGLATSLNHEPDWQTDLRGSLTREETMPESQSDAPDFGRRRALAQLALILTGLRSLSSLEDFSPEALLAEGAKLHRHVTNVTEKHVEDPRRLLFFNPHQFRTIDVICELIIPQTDTAGAHSAGVPQFVDFL